MNLAELNLEPLSELEEVRIDGGRSFWYDLAYCVGATARGFQAFADGAWAGSMDGPNHVFYK